MEQVGTIKRYPVYRLDKEMAVKYVTLLARLADLIPRVTYTEKEVLAESKPGRQYYGKWQHSLVVFDDSQPIAIIIGYEREKEENNLYPESSIYISELAVADQYKHQGIARQLIQLFLLSNTVMFHLKGDLLFTIQTNAADWNKHVVALYQSFGFRLIATKQYDNRTDVILRLQPKIEIRPE